MWRRVGHGTTAAGARGRPRVPAGLAALTVTAVLATGCGDGSTPIDRATSAQRPTTTTTTPSTTGPSTPAPDAPQPAGIPEDWRPAPLSWSPCDDVPRAECATLAVPLDWTQPAGPTVDLALARLPATGPADERIGPLLTNPGGPGGSGVEFLSYAPFRGDVRRRFDVVGWDPRGVGRSTAVSCNGEVDAFLRQDSAPDSAQEQQDLDAAAQAVSADCAARAGELLPHVGTLDVARDVEAIRRALGDGPLDYVGFSYGTQIGQEYLAMYPGRVRTMVLDGVVDPAQTFTGFLLGQTRGFDEAFRRSAAACARAGRSACGVDDLGAAYDRVAERVEREPLATDAGPVGPSELATAAVYTAYGSDGWQQLGPALADAERGQGAALRSLADGYYSLGGYSAYAAVVCVDNPAPRGAEEYRRFADEARRVSPRFGGSVANEMLPCASWPTAPVGAPGGVVAPGSPPVLVVGNTGDPATPLANAQAVAGRLASGVLVTVDVEGHTAYGTDACVTQLVDRYLLDRTVPAGDSRC